MAMKGTNILTCLHCFQIPACAVSSKPHGESQLKDGSSTVAPPLRHGDVTVGCVEWQFWHGECYERISGELWLRSIRCLTLDYW
ncbi:hypothetical protein TNCT_393681 [Trichonephila clavata]|uniref:Secreted protein n=1 Tax=Trichonephila clavata TaxID=2740835 RepID=A0A8X6LMR9_TRICU|nr:hypothetical protein TNCT_393681 [Trichonephila clavata]